MKIKRYNLDLRSHYNTASRNFFLKRIPDRTIATITRALEEKVLINSIFTTDGHLSYPRVAENLHLHHNVVNHGEGFWSYMKLEMRRQGGVMRRNNDEWIEDFSFRRKYLKNYESNRVRNIYIEILKILFAYLFYFKFIYPSFIFLFINPFLM
ncbi:hypothetical protein H311_00919 [Anncaliia algerae PRA109]|nr:hypothetical protein H311_00919 [Anncaliia algerae PRA109]